MCRKLPLSARARRGAGYQKSGPGYQVLEEEEDLIPDEPEPMETEIRESQRTSWSRLLRRAAATPTHATGPQGGLPAMTLQIDMAWLAQCKMPAV